MQLDLVGQEALAWFGAAVAYAYTLPAVAIVGLAIPFLAAFLARSGIAFMIAVLLTVVALTIPHAGPSERYQYSTLVLLVLSGLAAALLAAVSRYRDGSDLRAISAKLEEARGEISELEAELQRERDWRTSSARRAF
jgi:hypothetical protein